MSFKSYCYLQSRYRGGQYEVMNLSLFKVRRARVIKNKKQGGFIDRQRKGVGVGEEENRRSLFFVLAGRPRSPMFSKRTKSKKKRTSGNRLFFIGKAI